MIRATAGRDDSPHRRRSQRAWSACWPKLAAIVGAIALWQLVAWSGWRPPNILTLSRAARGYPVAVIPGAMVGVLIAGVPNLRRAIGSLITGMQTMPSIAWFPLAILLFG